MDDGGQGSAAREAGFDLVPVRDALFALLPAPENVAAVELAVEVHQAELGILEDAADAIQLLDAIVDAPSDGFDLALEIELLGRLSPIGMGRSGQELVAVDEIAPLGKKGRDIRDDATDEGQSAIGFGDGEVFRHGRKLQTSNELDR